MKADHFTHIRIFLIYKLRVLANSARQDTAQHPAARGAAVLSNGEVHGT
jgi:hypothetical protein